MKKEKALLILGFWILILNFLGFPRMFKSILFVLSGLAIIFLAYIFYKRAKSQKPVNPNEMHPFIDNVPTEE